MGKLQPDIQRIVMVFEKLIALILSVAAGEIAKQYLQDSFRQGRWGSSGVHDYEFKPDKFSYV